METNIDDVFGFARFFAYFRGDSESMERNEVAKVKLISNSL